MCSIIIEFINPFKPRALFMRHRQTDPDHTPHDVLIFCVFFPDGSAWPVSDGMVATRRTRASSYNQVQAHRFR